MGLQRLRHVWATQHTLRAYGLLTAAVQAGGETVLNSEQQVPRHTAPCSGSKVKARTQLTVFKGAYHCHTLNPYNEKKEDTQAPPPWWRPAWGLSTERRTESLVEKEFLLSVRRGLVLSLQVRNILEEKDGVSQYIWAPEHSLFGSMPLKKKSKTTVGLKHDHYPRVPVFFHCRDRPAKSIINSSLKKKKLNLINSESKYQVGSLDR